ncbi:SUMF1/EgtB/PvdO family nonheme iron enzyme, partial [bacterium]|nr:SUMF1/EgtB/PvdO family nonheme iron enzyme [bacterium]
GRVALGSAASRVEASPVVAKALKHSQELAASQKPQDLVLALKQLEDDIADLGARARAGALETERQAVKEKLDGIRKQTEKDLKEKVALLVSRDRFAAAIDAADPEDKALVALDLAPLAGELRAEAVKALASMRNEVYVKGGAYFTGQEGQAVLKGFYIDRTEVTNETWAKAVGKPGVAALASWRDGQPLPGTARQPVANVTFEEATRFAQAIGKRLPSTEEWEKAARGDKDARPYPWGERFEPGKAHLLGTPPDGLEDADARQNDASPYDVLGLAGNAAEWVTGAHGPLVAGGGYRSHERSARVFARMAARPETRDPGLGFRCARDVEPPDAPARGDEKK